MSSPCENKDVIKELKGDVLIIKERLFNGDLNFVKMQQTLDTVADRTADMNHRLFIDNGTKCVQTRINAMENVVKILTWMAMALTGTTLTILGSLIYNWLSSR